jgi:hypothetical protein
MRRGKAPAQAELRPYRRRAFSRQPRQPAPAEDEGRRLSARVREGGLEDGAKQMARMLGAQHVRKVGSPSARSSSLECYRPRLPECEQSPVQKIARRGLEASARTRAMQDNLEDSRHASPETDQIACRMASVRVDNEGRELRNCQESHSRLRYCPSHRERIRNFATGG